ncbi:MAG: hypothetical protein IPH57_05105 [Saprospiraceae bacterium]|nr:hypothetical protein [Saprospiraceae bacterium]
MDQSKFLKVFSMLAFIAFMFISCWATVESLHMLLPTWPIPIFWIATIGFFVLASIGSKLIVTSFNQNIRVDYRGWQLIGGTIMLVVFWILFSLPTNTHTFFYKSVINDVLVRDLTETKSKLQNLENEGDAKKIIDQEKADFRHKINAMFSKFAAEINNPGNLGWADKAEAVIIEIEAELGKIQRLRLRANTHSGRQELIVAMGNQIDKMVESKIENVYNQRITNVNNALDKPQIKKLIAEIQSVQNKLQAMPNKNGEPSEKTGIVLSQSYKIIDNYSDVLINEFDKTHSDKLKLAKEDKKAFSGVSRTEKMHSVIEVWKDFFNGKYTGRGFIFWILIAALVDIAGFIFFGIAFKKDEF